MLRTKLTDASDPESQEQSRMRVEINEEVGSDTLESEMPELESARKLSRDSSEATVSSEAHILGSVQVADNVLTSSYLYLHCSFRPNRSGLPGQSFLEDWRQLVSNVLSIFSSCIPS